MVKVLDVGAFLCKNCGHITHVKQTGAYVKTPCLCQYCKHVGPWKMVLEENSFVEMTKEEVQQL